MTRKEHPNKHLPALAIADTEILPATDLPLPLGGRSTENGREDNDEWADIAAKILIPRWAIECIQQSLVDGQELEEDYDEDDRPFPLETPQERVERIIQTPGELDKWRRIVGWGIQIVRDLDEQTAKKWNGGLMELLELGGDPPMPRWLSEVWRQGWGKAVADAYWDSWMTDVWSVVDKCSGSSPELDQSNRDRAKRLVAEGKSYWAWYSLPNKRPRLQMFFGNSRWRTNDVTQMVKCLTELMSPPSKRTLNAREIQMIAEGNMAYYRAHAGEAAEWMQSMARIKAIQSEAAAEVAGAKIREAEAEARARDAEAEMYQARADAERDVQIANQERDLAIAARKEADIARVQAETARKFEAEARQRAEDDRVKAEELARELADRAARAEGERDALRGTVETFKPSLEKIENHVKGVPAMVDSARMAWETPYKMASELEKQMAIDLSEPARRLWYAVQEAGSLNKGRKKAGLSYGTAHRLWVAEVQPFLVRNSLPDPVAAYHDEKPEIVSLDRMQGWGKRKR